MGSIQLAGPVRPLSNHVLLKLAESMKQTAGGLFVPEGPKDEPREGIVVEVGPGLVNSAGRVNPTSVKIGDNVLFRSYDDNKVS